MGQLEKRERERDNCTLVKEFQYGEKRFFCEKSQKQKVKIYFFLLEREDRKVRKKLAYSKKIEQFPKIIQKITVKNDTAVQISLATTVEVR